MDQNSLQKFYLNGKVCIITGGAGFLGEMHAEAIMEANGIPVLLDINQERIDKVVSTLKEKYQKDIAGFHADITNKKDLEGIREKIISRYNRIDVLINNAANDLKIEDKRDNDWSRFENFPEKIWDDDLNVSLKGAFFCSQIFGSYMVQRKKGVIVNISSDLGIIAPDQRIYREEGLPEEKQKTKPVSYSVAKHGLLGLTKYLATYWARQGIRVNTLCPSGISNHQEEAFVKRLTNLIPMGRMAQRDEYKSTLIFLISDASSYMTGSTVIVDGGRTCW